MSDWSIRNDLSEEVKRRVKTLGSKAVTEALEHILEEANRTVPIEEGTLMRSGSTSVDGTKGRVGYNTPYARRQHEDTRLGHDAGRRAKWLQLTVSERESAIKRLFADRLKEVGS